MNLQRCCTENNPKGFFLGDVIVWSGCIGVIYSVHISASTKDTMTSFTVSWVDQTLSKLEPGEKLHTVITIEELNERAELAPEMLQVLYGNTQIKDNFFV